MLANVKKQFDASQFGVRTAMHADVVSLPPRRSRRKTKSCHDCSEECSRKSLDPVPVYSPKSEKTAVPCKSKPKKCKQVPPGNAFPTVHVLEKTHAWIAELATYLENLDRDVNLGFDFHVEYVSDNIGRPLHWTMQILILLIWYVAGVLSPLTTLYWLYEWDAMRYFDKVVFFSVFAWPTVCSLFYIFILCEYICKGKDPTPGYNLICEKIPILSYTLTTFSTFYFSELKYGGFTFANFGSMISFLFFFNSLDRIFRDAICVNHHCGTPIHESRYLVRKTEKKATRSLEMFAKMMRQVAGNTKTKQQKSSPKRGGLEARLLSRKLGPNKDVYARLL